MAPRFRLRVRMAPRDLDRFPAEDEPLVSSVFDMLQAALVRGVPRPVMLVLQGDQINQFDLAPVVRTPPQHRERMMSAMAAQDDAECAVLAGVLRFRSRRQGGEGTRVALVYAEWPDNRWMSVWQPLGREREPLLADGPVVRAAIDGHPRPGGLGGWYARARRDGLKLRLETGGDTQVH